MVADAVAAEIYSIIKDKTVIDYLKGSGGASVRDKLIDAIDELQSQPFPANSETRRVQDKDMTWWVIDTNPRSQLVYSVDKVHKNVYVISITELRFS